VRLESINESVFLLTVGIVTCPRCGEDIEIWTETDEATCLYCNYKLFRKERTVH